MAECSNDSKKNPYFIQKIPGSARLWTIMFRALLITHTGIPDVIYRSALQRVTFCSYSCIQWFNWHHQLCNCFCKIPRYLIVLTDVLIIYIFQKLCSPYVVDALNATVTDGPFDMLTTCIWALTVNIMICTF